MELKIEYIGVDELTPYAKNARRHTDYDVTEIAKSIKKYGFDDPIGIWGAEIVEGHGRLLAAKKLGMNKVPCIRLEHLSDKERREYAILHNKTAELSEWDGDMLKDELAELNFGDFDIDFGLFNAEEDVADIIEDEPPELDEDTLPTTKIGDIYQLGRHRLMCGDSTKITDVKKLLGGAVAHMAFADPPYGYMYHSNHTKKFGFIQNDDKILNFFPTLKSSVDGFIYVCTTWKIADEWVTLFKKYYDLTNVVIWDKGGGGIGDLKKTFSTDYEMILVSNCGHSIRGRRYGSVWDFTRRELEKMKKNELISMLIEQKKFGSVWHESKDNPAEYIHPTQKPVSLSARAIRSSTDAGAKIFDVFGGSGSTLMACEQIDRACYCMELDPKFCDGIVKRWEKFTGKTAIREGH